MTFVAILESLVLGPLKILFEYIFKISDTIIHNPGLSIIFLSLAMNVLVLPLYRRADEMQEEARRVEEKLREGIAHIKKHFSGDERMMMLQTYYNQNNYKPTHALRGSTSLLLQIPFFMAAYGFLSNLADLQGAALGPIKNLGVADGLISIGGMSINLLPILMTLINVISATIYLKGFPMKTKVQTYGMALFFLVFLYKSPAGLVFYWTLNNLFSLLKTIYFKLKVPKSALLGLITAVGVGLIGFALFGNVRGSVGPLRRSWILLILGVVLQMAWVLPVLKRALQKTSLYRRWMRRGVASAAPNKKLFLAGSLFLTLLVGTFISSTYIAASPQEFVDVSYFYHPLWYVLNTLCLSAGTFLVWLRVFYWLAPAERKVAFERGVWMASGVMIVNYMCFGLNFGVLSSTLQYEGLPITLMEAFVNLLVVIAVALVLYLFVKRWTKAATSVLTVCVVVLGILSLKNTLDIKKSIDRLPVGEVTDAAHFELSQNGQNVIVIQLDRAMGAYVPYIFNEKPELLEKFDGFTYYSNTICFGKTTVFTTPAMAGGYEYTPVEINRDDSRPLVEKHNEAWKVLPVLFSENGYEVTVCDPAYANYQWIPDLSIYDDYPAIHTYNTKGSMNTMEHRQYVIESTYRNFFCFSLMKCMPLLAQEVIYDTGRYYMTHKVNQRNFSNQVLQGYSKAQGNKHEFLSAYNVLDNMDALTQVTAEGKNTFLLMKNNTTHDPSLLQTPDYVPADAVDNTQYDAENADRFTLEDGSTLTINDLQQMTHYHANMAALLRLGEWFDYLRESGVYDNTKIILVSDHGYSMSQLEALAYHSEEIPSFTTEVFFPLLLVKDFNSEGFTVSDEFMTNADVPTLATDGTIENPVNPFTGNPINSDEKYAHDQILLYSDNWGVVRHAGNTFSGQWISVSDSLWEEENWEFYGEETVLKEHKLPTED